MSLHPTMQKEADDLLALWKPFLETKGIAHLEFLCYGKRGVIFTGTSGKIGVGIKIERPSSKAMGRIRIEAENLKKINALDVGPKFVDYGEWDGHVYLIYEFAKGTLIGDMVEQCSIEQWKSVVPTLLKQMFILDCAALTKEEMQHPYKHVVISDDMYITLIDFERMHADLSPKNVRQCVQYLIGINVSRNWMSHADRKKMLPLLQEYKRSLEYYLSDKDGKTELDTSFTNILDYLLGA